MSDSKYYNIGMAPFNMFAKEQPAFAGNFKAVDEIISRMAVQHAATVEKFGYSYSLDLIFIREVAKYYSAITKLPASAIESFIPIICKVPNDDSSDDTPFMRERVIFYPTFEHDTDGNAVAHVPCTESFVVDKNTILFRAGENSGYIPVNSLEHKNIDEILGSFSVLLNSAAQYWADKYKLNKKESSILKERMNSEYIEHNCALYKEDFIR